MLLIIGSGRCVWDDLQKIGFPDNRPKADVMAVNDMIVHFPYTLKHAYSLNREMLNHWLAARTYPDHPIRHSNRRPHVRSSGLNAVFCGLDLGYDEITVCGVPLDNSGHYFEPPWLQSVFTSGHAVEFPDNVQFVSGRLSCHSWSSTEN